MRGRQRSKPVPLGGWRPARARVVATAAIVALVVGGASVSALAHGPVHQQIRQITARIEAAPKSAALYLDRGRMFLTQAHVRRARADFRRALSLDPTLTAAHYFLAETELAAGRAQRAETHARRFLDQVADDNRGALIRGHRLLAKILVARRKLRDAVGEQRTAISLATAPLPDDYLQLAETLRRIGRVDEGVAALDAGVAKLGPLAALEQRALELELEAGQRKRALARLDRLIAAERWPLPWMVRRAEALVAQGPNASARAAVTETLAFIERLSARRRRAPAVRSLEKRVRRLFARLDTAGRRPSAAAGEDSALDDAP